MESAAVTRETVSVGFGERLVADFIDVIIVNITTAIAFAIFGAGLHGLGPPSAC